MRMCVYVCAYNIMSYHFWLVQKCGLFSCIVYTFDSLKQKIVGGDLLGEFLVCASQLKWFLLVVTNGAHAA